MFLFKVLGLIIGSYFADAGGAILGIILGHAFDAGLVAKLDKMKFEREAKRAADQQFHTSFLTSLFGMLSCLAHADQIVNDAELQTLHRIIDHYMKPNRAGKKFALEVFAKAPTLPRGFHSYAVQFYEATHGDTASCQFALNALVEMAAADGPINDEEGRFIQSAVDVFNLGQDFGGAEYIYQQQAEPDANAELDYCYSVLGCTKDNSDDEIKKSYRQLVSDYHPDRIVSKELPEDFMRFANEKFKLIQAAYDTVKKDRGMK